MSKKHLLKSYLFTFYLFIVSITLLLIVNANVLDTQNISMTIKNIDAGEIYVATGTEEIELYTNNLAETSYVCSGGTDIKNLAYLKYGDIVVFTIKSCKVKTFPAVNIITTSVDFVEYDCVYEVQGLEQVSDYSYRVINKVVIEKIFIK